MNLLSILTLAVSALQILVIVDALLSWFQQPDQFPRSLTTQITDPLYAPIRAVLRPEATGGFDLSPIIIILLLRFLENMLQRAAM